ncbi:MAG: glycoside hydrolase family 3 protein [Candidatus Aminicenantes bacterium]|nr:glycoside hydrolase family 3 protein [Candidatus Aminicenantes bacterium]
MIKGILLKNRRGLFCLFVILLFLSSCVREPLKPSLTLSDSGMRWAHNTLKKLTLEEKIAQMISCRFRGHFHNLDSDVINRLEYLVKEQKVGGMIIFGGEAFESAYLINRLQEKSAVPLIIASDLERGLGNQINGATLFPPLMSLGAAGSKELAYQMGKVTALEARAVGIHITYAPVVDVNINPQNPIINTRSLGEDPGEVGRLAAAFIRGCQDNGLIATAKHFPGHGDTAVDSHTELPVVNTGLERLNHVELYPFRKAIEAGVLSVMTAHIQIPVLDPTPDLPATLSPAVITEHLRKKLGFQGLIVTDAMEMGGVTTLFTPEEACIKAVRAGVDCLLLPLEKEKVMDALVQEVRSGRIPESRINESVLRILRAKAKLGLHKQKLVDMQALPRVLASKEHLVQAQKTFEASVTLVKNRKNLVPVLCETKRIAVFSLSSDKGGFFAGQPFTNEVTKRCEEVFEFYAEPLTGDEFISQAVKQSDDADVRIITLFSRLYSGKGNVGLNQRHIQLINKLAEDEVPLVVISFGSPYFLKHFPDVDTYICAYRRAPLAQQAAAKAVFGEIGFRGHLPVSIPGLYKVGHGIMLEKKIQFEHNDET